MNGEFLWCSDDIVVWEIIQTGKEKEKGQADNADVLVILLLLVGLKFFVIPGDTQEVQKKKFTTHAAGHGGCLEYVPFCIF